MQSIVYLTPDLAVTGELQPADLAEIASLGFKSLVNNRPDSEEEGQMTNHTEASHAWRHGLRYRFVPSSKLDLFTDNVVEGMADALANLPRPILAHCKSGIRSAIIWAAASARQTPVDDVLAALAAAGFDLDFLRDELDTQADRHRWIGETKPSEQQPRVVETADAA